MILFAKDWAQYPTAIIDLQTPNRSFVRIAQLYKSMGVKNHAFPLALIQPELQGVDPHSPNLSQEQKVLIALECRYNPWYYFREVVRLPPQAGPKPVVFQANRGNMALFWSFFNHIDCANVQPRQTGKSASTDTLMDWLLYIGASNTSITMITKDNDLRKKNVERLKGIRDYLPRYLVSIQPDDADNQVELTCNLLGNDYKTGVAQNSEAAANKVGRGLTSPVLHSDEGPFTSFIDITLPAALAAGTAARDEAKQTGNPYGSIFTTTAGKKDSRDGAFMYDMIHSGAPWTEAFLDAHDQKELEEMVRLNGSGRKPLINITMSHRQLGKSDEWLYEAIANTRGSAEQAERDFLNVWTAGSLSSPLSVALNEAIRNSEMDVLFSEISPERYILRWFVPEDEILDRMAQGHYVIGLDTSEAVGRDTIALEMVDIRDLSVVAAGTYNETNLIRFSSYLTNLLYKYQRTTLVIEKKSTGQMIIDYLLLKLPGMGIDPFKRLFNRIVDEARENEQSFRELNLRLEVRPESFYDQRKGKLGFVTTADNRNLLYTTVLQNAAKKAAGGVHDKTLASEITGLVVKNGRIDHTTSGHDDHAIAWLLAHWFITHARNLHYYGIDHNDVMSAVTEMGREMSPLENAAREQQNQFLNEIDEILDTLKKASNEMIIAQLEHRLRVLTGRLSSVNVDESFSIDALIQGAAEERMKNQRIQARANPRAKSQELNVNTSYRLYRV